MSQLDTTKVASTRAVGHGNCPFRGLPHYELDDRCPDVVPVVDIDADIAIRRVDNPVEVKESSGAVGRFAVPIMRAESGCAECMRTRRREQEAGAHISGDITVHKARRMSGVRRRRAR